MIGENHKYLDQISDRNLTPNERQQALNCLKDSLEVLQLEIRALTYANEGVLRICVGDNSRGYTFSVHPEDTDLVDGYRPHEIFMGFGKPSDFEVNLSSNLEHLAAKLLGDTPRKLVRFLDHRQAVKWTLIDKRD